MALMSLLLKFSPFHDASIPEPHKADEIKWQQQRQTSPFNQLARISSRFFRSSVFPPPPHHLSRSIIICSLIALASISTCRSPLPSHHMMYICGLYTRIHNGCYILCAVHSIGIYILYIIYIYRIIPYIMLHRALCARAGIATTAH